jgi:hypothetical protein
MITPKNPLFQASLLKRSAVSPVTALGLFQNLNTLGSMYQVLTEPDVA